MIVAMMLVIIISISLFLSAVIAILFFVKDLISDKKDHERVQ
jgi:type IV secretory pathway VirB3-like protein